MSRFKTYISRDNSISNPRSEDPSWVSDFVKNLEKSAVKSKQDDFNMFEQINSILGNSKGKHSSVEDKILDMQRRTGLLEINTVKNKIAQMLNSKYENSKYLNDIPILKTFIDNYVEERPGTSVDAVVHSLLKVKEIKDSLPNSDDVPSEIKHYINDKILESNMQAPNSGNNLNIGKVDHSDADVSSSDPFAICMPAKDK